MFTQGDAFNLEIVLSVNMDDVEKIEFTVGNLVKVYPGEVNYVQPNELFLFPLKQEDTLKMQDAVKYQARVKYKDGNVIATKIYSGNVLDSLSTSIL